jgi:hypothetical protein
MELTLTTPSLLFPALSLLMLAYTNRFLGLASVIRNLHAQYEKKPDLVVRGQIENLRRRLLLTRNMQACGALSILCCVLCMCVLFLGWHLAGVLFFVAALGLLALSLALSFVEIQISVQALNLLLRRFDDEPTISL